MTVLVELLARAKILARVKPGSFVPPPRVDSAFVGLELHRPPIPEDELDEFQSMVRLAFSQRRKTLRNALGAGFGKGQVEAWLATAGVSARARAEALTLSDFMDMHRSRPGSIEGSDRIQKG